jgi:hypothetical protein
LKLYFKKLKIKIKPYLKPTMFISFAIAWMITNGWAYLMLAFGIRLNITWMITVSSVYLGVLWLPITPEKLITIPLSIFIQKLLFNKEKE